MTQWIMNARMYAVTPDVETAWRELLQHVADESGVPMSYVSYPAPQPLEALWQRPDLGAVFMCGFPIAKQLARVVPIAAPLPRAAWAMGGALYRSNLIVHRASDFQTLEDTFGGRAGFTVAHSHSGFNAFRHHLLRYRTKDRPTLYAHMSGDLVTARRVLDSVRERQIDIGPLDSYWHALIERHSPMLTRDIRVLDATEAVPLPAFVAAENAPAAMVGALRSAFLQAATRPWFAGLSDILLLDGFAGVESQRYAKLLDWDREALQAGYAEPS
jgi:ABC-type phosphate/phosphonate transport system substrate-binding protein